MKSSLFVVNPDILYLIDLGSVCLVHVTSSRSSVMTELFIVFLSYMRGVIDLPTVNLNLFLHNNYSKDSLILNQL